MDMQEKAGHVVSVQVDGSCRLFIGIVLFEGATDVCVMVWRVANSLRSPDFLSCLVKTSLVEAFAIVRLS